MMHIVAAVAAGLLERVWPSTVPAHDYDLLLAAAEADYETFEPLPDSTPAGGLDPAAGVPPDPAAGLPTPEWLAIAVLEVLSTHTLQFDGSGDCWCAECSSVFGDLNDWYEHIAPDVSEHVLKCIGSYTPK